MLYEVITAYQDVHRLLDRGRLRIVPDRVLRPVRRRHVGAALHVVTRDMHFVRRERIQQITHARGGILGVLRFRKARYDFLECEERFAASYNFV